MATTTNYGWATPDDTDLVKDGAAAIRTLGSSIDTTTKALNPETTTGDIAYRSATTNTNTRLALGTAGQVLTVNSGATAPEWAAPAGGGKVLQVVTATTSTPVSNNTNTYADTGLTASITPSAATSKILVLVTQNGTFKDSTNSQNAVVLNLMRGATQIWESRILMWQNALTNLMGMANISYLDSPSTTSSTTYKTQFKNLSNSVGVDVQNGTTTSTIILIEIGA